MRGDEVLYLDTRVRPDSIAAVLHPERSSRAERWCTLLVRRLSRRWCLLCPLPLPRPL